MWAFGAAKLSVIFFYRGIFRGRYFDLASWTMVGIVVAWTLGAFMAVTFQCGSHFTYLFTSAASIARHCSSGMAIGIGFAIPDVITDGLILAMPLYWVSSCPLRLCHTTFLTFIRPGNYRCRFRKKSVFVGSAYSVRCKLCNFMPQSF